jgi:hypothetical protein
VKSLTAKAPRNAKVRQGFSDALCASIKTILPCDAAAMLPVTLGETWCFLASWRFADY